MKKVKTCIYTISLNEIKNVDLYMECNKQADLVVICDTGSTDGTVERFEKLGAKVYSIRQNPWRFDIPRNTALNLIPNDIDICLSIDVDEYLQSGWYEALTEIWENSKGKVNRISYNYVWNWQDDNKTPDCSFFADKIHSRHGYVWKHPCHETLYWQKENEEQKFYVSGITLHHRQDSQKDRKQYLSLLHLAVSEAPESDRMCFYYARELLLQGNSNQAAVEFKRHISLKSALWNQEKAASMRFLSKIEKENEEYWLLKAISEYSLYKEAILDLSYLYYRQQDYELCYIYAKKAIQITKHSSYFSESFAYGDFQYDLASIAAYNIGIKNKAIEYAKLGLEINPDNQRLRNNLEEFLKE